MLLRESAGAEGSRLGSEREDVRRLARSAAPSITTDLVVPSMRERRRAFGRHGDALRTGLDELEQVGVEFVGPRGGEAVREILMSSSSAPLSTPEGPVSVSGAPNLPAGFTDTFTSRYINTGELRLHAVIGRSTSAVWGCPTNPRAGTTPAPSPATWSR